MNTDKRDRATPEPVSVEPGPCRGIRIYNAPGEEDLTGVISSACSGSLETALGSCGDWPPRATAAFT